MESVKLVIFDLDGTLFRTESVDIVAFNRALACNGFMERKAEEILGLVGLPLEDICKILLATDDEVLLSKFKNELIKFEEEEIKLSGELYPGVVEFLERLKNRGYTLCICSNGNEEYVTDISTKFGFFDIFEEIWFEKKGISKSQAVGILKHKYNADKFIMVGDRISDVEAGKDNEGISIGVSYGFGKNEIEEAHYIASDIEQLEATILSIKL